MTMVTVRLLRMADRKKVKNPMVQNSDFLDLVVMRLVITLNPWWASTTSTMVEAANKKKQMSASFVELLLVPERFKTYNHYILSMFYIK